jgi:hypothetical protein
MSYYPFHEKKPLAAATTLHRLAPLCTTCNDEELLQELRLWGVFCVDYHSKRTSHSQNSWSESNNDPSNFAITVIITSKADFLEQHT